MAESKSLLVYTANGPVEAHALVAYLASEGIEARVVGDALQGAYGGLGAGDLMAVEVWVSEADRAKAQPLIAQWRLQDTA